MMDNPTITGSIDLVSSDLLEIRQILEKASRERRTKREMHSFIDAALHLLETSSEKLVKYRSPLAPLVAGDEKNTIHDEARKVRDDIGSVQYMLLHHMQKDADELLQDIKERI